MIKLPLTCEKTLGSSCSRADRGLALIHNDSVCKVGCHNEVMLHNESCLLGVHDVPLDNLQHPNLSGKPIKLICLVAPVKCSRNLRLMAFYWIYSDGLFARHPNGAYLLRKHNLALPDINKEPDEV